MKEDSKNQNEHNNVIRIPTRMNQKHQNQSRLRNQRFAAAISLGSVIVVSVFLNQILIGNQSQQSNLEGVDVSGRFIASLPSNPDPASLKWEASVAADLNSSNYKMKGAEKPSISDHLLFGELRGQYTAVLNENLKITKLQLIGDGQQEIIQDYNQFLLAKKDLFSVSYDSVFAIDLEKQGDSQTLQYKLLKNSEVVGQATIERNAFGHLKTLEIRKN